MEEIRFCIKIWKIEFRKGKSTFGSLERIFGTAVWLFPRPLRTYDDLHCQTKKKCLAHWVGVIFVFLFRVKRRGNRKFGKKEG